VTQSVISVTDSSGNPVTGNIWFKQKKAIKIWYILQCKQSNTKIIHCRCKWKSCNLIISNNIKC
jgi:hypothetical protein